MYPQELNLKNVRSTEHMHSIWMWLTEEFLASNQDTTQSRCTVINLSYTSHILTGQFPVSCLRIQYDWCTLELQLPFWLEGREITLWKGQSIHVRSQTNKCSFIPYLSQDIGKSSPWQLFVSAFLPNRFCPAICHLIPIVGQGWAAVLGSNLCKFLGLNYTSQAD